MRSHLMVATEHPPKLPAYNMYRPFTIVARSPSAAASDSTTVYEFQVRRELRLIPAISIYPILTEAGTALSYCRLARRASIFSACAGPKKACVSLQNANIQVRQGQTTHESRGHRWRQQLMFYAHLFAVRSAKVPPSSFHSWPKNPVATTPWAPAFRTFARNTLTSGYATPEVK